MNSLSFVYFGVISLFVQNNKTENELPVLDKAKDLFYTFYFLVFILSLFLYNYNGDGDV